MKVLIVDDSASMRMIVKRTLKAAGFSGLQIVEAGDGAQALEAIAASPPDLIMCDWNMPVMNGLELLKKLRSDDNPVKFGFVTTESTGPMKQAAREAGAQFIIAKPFTAESFENALRPVIG